MASVTYSLNIDRLDRIVMAELMSEGGIVHDDLLARAIATKQAVVDNIRSRAIKNSEGGLADSIEGRTLRNDDDEWDAFISADEAHAEQALWFEEGTGIHGPLNHMIFPSFYPNMIFKPYGLTKRVFAAKVQGQKAHHAFRDAIDAATR